MAVVMLISMASVPAVFAQNDAGKQDNSIVLQKPQEEAPILDSQEQTTIDATGSIVRAGTLPNGEKLTIEGKKMVCDDPNCKHNSEECPTIANALANAVRLESKVSKRFALADTSLSWFSSQLDLYDKSVYDQILAKVDSLDYAKPLSLIADIKTEADAFKFLDALYTSYGVMRAERPDIFWVPDSVPYDYAKISESEYVFYLDNKAFLASNIYTDTDAVKAEQSDLNTKIAAAKDVIDAKGATDDYSKLKAIHDYITGTITYNYDALNTTPSNPIAAYKSHQITGGFNGLAVCDGYAKSYMTLSRLYNIPCVVVMGDAGGGHAWNYVSLDGAWYAVDTTWDDPSDLVSYEYFMIGKNTLVSSTTGQIMFSQSHKPSGRLFNDDFKELSYPTLSESEYIYKGDPKATNIVMDPIGEVARNMPFALSATVTNPGGGLIPTGHVNFYALGLVDDEGKPLPLTENPVELVNGKASGLSNIALKKGGYGYIYAEYISDNKASFDTSVSRTVYITVKKTALTVTGLKVNPVEYNASRETVTIDVSNAKLNGVIVGDDVSIDSLPTEGIILDNSVGIRDVILTNIGMVGKDADYYVLEQPKLTVEIKAQTSSGGTSSGDTSSGGTSSGGHNYGGTSPFASTSSTTSTPTTKTAPAANKIGVIDNSLNAFPVTDAMALASVQNAIKDAKAFKSKNVNVQFINTTSISKAVLASIADNAKKSGKTATILSDTVIDGRIIARMYINPALNSKVKNPIDLRVDLSKKATQQTVDIFNKFFKNKITVVSLGQPAAFDIPVSLAVKVDLKGYNTKSLYFYSYNRGKNTYSRIAAPKSWIDKQGFLHFDTSIGGDIIITDKPLTSK